VRCDYCGEPIKVGEPYDKRLNFGDSGPGSEIFLHKRPCYRVEARQPRPYPLNSQRG
jgi:hypothetical protein